MEVAIDALTYSYVTQIDKLAEELSTGNYKKLFNCPSYATAKVLMEALRSLEKHLYGKAMSLTVQQEMTFRGLMEGRGVLKIIAYENKNNRRNEK